ncbi:MAG TPA: sulfatase, partial [Acidimicrobiales bacterium]|nr:sulfatase [Acidimicrobiales bacterium]
MRAQIGAARPGLAALALLALVAGCGGEESNPAVEPDPAFGKQPNVVFVLTDDQDLASYNRRTMPNTVRLLERRGTTFTDYLDATALCCPSRAALITGQYGHNNGVLNNKPGYTTLRDPDNVLPVWLNRAGYETAYVGKFLNGYERAVEDKKTVAPGWDHWRTLVGKHSYYEFKLAVDGEDRKRKYKGRYLTDVLNRTAVQLIRDELSGETPFFLQLAQLAPHVENGDSGGRCGTYSVPAPRDRGRFSDAPLPSLPGVEETDVSDKPTFIRELPPLSDRKRAIIERRYRCRLESLGAADRGVKQLVRALRQTGELSETVIVFTSDNGNFHGEHRLPGAKGLPYAEASRVPLVMRVPAAFRGGAPVSSEIDDPVANIDVVPTIVEWAGTETCPEAGDCRVMDGRSLLPLLEGRATAWPADRPIATEFDIGKDEIKPGRGTACEYRGVHQGRWTYVRHTSVPDLATGVCAATDQVELYDAATDPYQLENLAGEAADVERRLAALTDELADC